WKMMRYDGLCGSSATHRASASLGTAWIHSFLQPANERYKSFYLFVGKRATESLHFFFAVFVFQPFLDLLEHLLIGERRLICRVGQVLNVGFSAGFGFAFAVLAMTGCAMFFPILLHVRRAERGGSDGKTGCDNDCFFHSDLRCCIVELPTEPGSALMSFKNSLALLRVPGTNGNSPAIHRWVWAGRPRESRDERRLIPASLINRGGSVVPSGLS